MPECRCSGVRFCAACVSSDRVQLLQSGAVDLRSPAEIISNQSSELRTSSCLFSQVRETSLFFCIDCKKVFELCGPIRACTDHAGARCAHLRIDDFFVMREGLCIEDEQKLISSLDNAEWKDSQSGRRKQEYGPRRNFKKKKVNLPVVPGVPKALKTLLEAASAFAVQCTRNEFVLAEASVLEYTDAKMSSFDPHVDDTWLWGPRIVGVNLLEDCVFSFVNAAGEAVNALLPRRCFFLMSGDCRYNWMHGIHPTSFVRRRVSVTLRELSLGIKEDQPEICDAILANAKLFV